MFIFIKYVRISYPLSEVIFLQTQVSFNSYSREKTSKKIGRRKNHVRYKIKNIYFVSLKKRKIGLLITRNSYKKLNHSIGPDVCD
jgi:hypothetical protein